MKNSGNKDVKCAKDKDISAELLYAFSVCTSKIGLSYFNELIPSIKINKCKSEGFDEKNPSIILKNHPYCFRSNNIIKRILGLSVNYPKECNEMPLIKNDCDILNKLSSIDGIVVERMCISEYDYVSELSQLEQWEWYINLSEKDFIDIFKNKSLDSAVSTYSNEIRTEDSRTIINEYQKKANRLYEKACSYLETLTENIIKVSNRFKNNLSNDDNMNIFHEFVNSKLFDVVFNAGLLKLRIEISNSKEKCPDIMFTVLQDLIVNVTDLLKPPLPSIRPFLDFS